MNVLVVNPGGNSLKVEIVACEPSQRHPWDGKKLASVAIEGIGKSARLMVYEGKKVQRTERIRAADLAQAVDSLVARFENHPDPLLSNPLPNGLPPIDLIGLRVVHGGPKLGSPTPITPAVARQIAALETLAPLHNKSSIEMLDPIRRSFGRTPLYAVFDTAFHRTIPERAALYAIPLSLSRKHHIRRYGFHGISHRYLLERYAHLAGKAVEQCTIVTTHLESGCSVTAIRAGKSIDNTMGLTPLEGLMMGTRSGDVDPSLISLLVKEERMKLDEVIALLNRQSGLFGVSGRSLDTRVLMQHYATDPRARLAVDMFAYRLRKAIGAYLAALGGAEAIVFGGGIGENGVHIRDAVGAGLRWCGLNIDAKKNASLIDVEGRLSSGRSSIEAWVVPVEEGLQIAHECVEVHIRV